MLRRLLLVAFVVMVFSPAFGQVTVFVTSGTTQGDLGGLVGADSFCNGQAGNGGLTGTWTAWLSDSTTDARDRILDAQYVLTNGLVVADSLAELTSGTLQRSIDVDEFLLPAGGGNPWTGTQSDGTATADNCSDWTDNTAGSQGVQGDTDTTGPTWTHHANTVDCNFQRQLYCFSDVNVPVEMEEAGVE